MTRAVNDSLQSLVSGMGDPGRDKSASTFYGVRHLTDLDLMNAYRNAWLPQKIVNIPAYDSVRAWRNWQADTDQITAIEAEEKRLGLHHKVLDALIKARLWGGAAIYMSNGDADISQPMSVESVRRGGLRYLTVMSRREIAAGPLDTDPLSETYARPSYYTVNGREIHASRLAVFVGAENPDPWFNFGLTYGWGDSVLQAVYDAIRDTDSTTRNVASLVFEANVDVFGVPDFLEQVADPEYERRMLARFALVNAGKSINRSIIRDAQETYERKSIAFGGLEGLVHTFLQIVSGAADIPAARLLGQTPAGLASTGEADIRNYYDRLASDQSLKVAPALARLDEALIRSALGNRPPEVWYNWSPLWQISDKERAEIGKLNADTANVLTQTGLLPPVALANSVVNQMVELGVYPGLDQEVEEAGGMPDYLGEPDNAEV